MINLAAAAVLVRDLTEQQLDGATGGAPAGRSRQAPPSRTATARQRQAALSAEPVLPRPGRARRRMPRSA